MEEGKKVKKIAWKIQVIQAAKFSTDLLRTVIIRH